MRRHVHTVLLILAPLALLAAVACAGAGDDGSGSPIEQTTVACGAEPDPQACLERVNDTLQASRPTAPPPDPRIKEVLLENTVVKRLIADGVERQDFWLIIDQFSKPAHGDQGGMAIVIFAEPVSYSGDVPTASDPCKGHGVEGHVDPDDPCLEEPRQYSTRETTFEDVRVVDTQVDTGRGEVVRLFPNDSPDDIVEDMIAWAEKTQY